MKYLVEVSSVFMCACVWWKSEMCCCVYKWKKESRNWNFSHKFLSVPGAGWDVERTVLMHSKSTFFFNFWRVFLSIFQCFRVSYNKNVTTWSVCFNIDPPLFLQRCKGHPIIYRLPHQNYPHSARRGKKLSSKKQLLATERQVGPLSAALWHVLSAQLEQPGTLMNRQRWHLCQCVCLWVAVVDSVLHIEVIAGPQLGTEKGRPAQHWNPVPVLDTSYSLLSVSHMQFSIKCYAESVYRIFSPGNMHFPYALILCPEFPRAMGGMGDPIYAINRTALQLANEILPLAPV